MQTAILPPHLIGKVLWEHPAPISAEDVMDERRKLPAVARVVRAASRSMTMATSTAGYAICRQSAPASMWQGRWGVPATSFWWSKPITLRRHAALIWRTITRLGVAFTG
jgi:hypothetical protein